MSQTLRQLRDQTGIPQTCPYQGFAPAGETAEKTVPIPACGSTNIAGPFFKVKKRFGARSTTPFALVISRSWFCRDCHHDVVEDFKADAKVDVLLLDKLGIKP